MPGIFPEGTNGGRTVRNTARNCLDPAGVTNAYCPGSDFETTCPVTALADDCSARLAPAQVNALVSEILCFAETLNPTGTWNCATTCNLTQAFNAWKQGVGLNPQFNENDFFGEGSLPNPYSIRWSRICAAATPSDTITDMNLLACGPNGSIRSISSTTMIQEILEFTGQGIFDTRQEAAAAAAAAGLAQGDILYVAGHRYEVNSIGPDGLVAVDMDYRGQFQEVVARMDAGQAVRVNGLGDSTTDGNRTSGWTANPVDGAGNAVGAGAHTPPNAWPALFQTLLRRMYQNPNIQVWNAGYGGKQLVDGWARRNFARAVINNPAYGTPDVCIINFGLNDIVREIFTVDQFWLELRYLLSLMDYYGITPVLMTTDPVIENTPRQGGSISVINSLYKRASELFGIELIDSHNALLDVFSSNGTNALWAYQQPDDLHGTDNWHRVKGSYAAARFFNKTLWLDEPDSANAASWSRYANTQKKQYSIYDEANNRFGASLNIAAGSYIVGEALVDMFVWTRSSTIGAYWRSVSGDGYYYPAPLDSAPVLEVGSYFGGSVVRRYSPTAGQTQQLSPNRDAEVPAFLRTMLPGLTRLTFLAPTDSNNRALFLGYFAFRKETKPMSYATFIQLGGGGQQLVDPNIYENQGDLVGTGFGLPCRMLIDTAMPIGTGLLLYTGRVFSDGSGGVSARRRGLALVRSGANISLAVLQMDISGGILDWSNLASAAYTWSETSNEFIVRFFNNGADLGIQITPASAPLAPLITVTRTRDTAPWPLGGHTGGFVKDYAISPSAGRARYQVYEISYQ